MSTAVLLLMAPSWKQYKCPSIAERIDTLVTIHTMGYQSDKKAGSPNAHNNIDESQKQRLHEKKNRYKRVHTVYYFIKFKKWEWTSSDWKQIRGCLVPGLGRVSHKVLWGKFWKSWKHSTLYFLGWQWYWSIHLSNFIKLCTNNV